MNNAMAQQLKEAREQRAVSFAKIKELGAKVGAPEWSEETDGAALDIEQRTMEALETTCTRLNGVVEMELRANGWSGVAAEIGLNLIEKAGDSRLEAKKNYSLMRSIGLLMSNKPLDGLEGEMAQEAVLEARDTGRQLTGNFQLPSFLLGTNPGLERMDRRDVTANIGSQGGFTIDTKLGPLIEFLYPRLTVKDMGATYFGNQTSNLSFPRNNVAGTATWATTENATAVETSPAFDILNLTPKRMTSFIDLSRQNVIQNIAIENFVREQLNMAVMQMLDRTAFTGTGASGIPLGILATPGVNDIDLGANGGALNWARVVQFETMNANENADMGRLGYITTPGVSGFLKTEKKDVAGNGFIWEGRNDSAEVNGYRAMATSLMPNNLTDGAGTNLHAMIFGNWRELLIAQFGGLDLLVNPYTKGKEALIEVIVHAWYDMGVRHNKSFTICNEIIV